MPRTESELKLTQRADRIREAIDAVKREKSDLVLKDGLLLLTVT